MLKVIKIGGNIVDNPEKLDSFLNDFASLQGGKILVHGGGKVATGISKALGIETSMVNGRRVTDGETLDVVTMVYAGLINKKIVNKLNALGCPAVGICGADGNFITSRKRDPFPVDYGYVGDPEHVDIRVVEALQKEGFNIVAAPITTDSKGQLLNTNADTVAQAIAVAMAKHADVELIFCFEKQGVLRDIDDECSVIPEIDRASFLELKNNGIVNEGMLPKLENAFSAIGEGVKKVVICSAANLTKEGYGGTSVVG